MVPYNPAWRAGFAALRAVWAAALGDLALRIKHIGNTSIPGMCAKDVLDVDIVIASRDVLPEVVERLAALGYWHSGDQGVPGREVFKRADASVPRDGSGREWMRHHLYVCPEDSRELCRHLAFRDYLLSHPAAAEEYAALKRELAERHANDVDAYCKAKTDFVENILRRALGNNTPA